MSLYQETHPFYRELEVLDYPNGRIKLIEPELKYAQTSLSWIRDPEIIQYMGGDFNSPSLSKEQARLKKILTDRDEYHWMIELDGKIIGNVNLNSIAEVSEKLGMKAAYPAILIGEKKYWNKGIGFYVLKTVIDWALNKAGFEALSARALPQNIASIKNLLKLGFKENGTEPYEGLIQGQKTVWQKFILTKKNAPRSTDITSARSTKPDQKPFQLMASCAFGLEKIVYDEIKKLGLWVIKTEDGKVTFYGDEKDLLRANLWLRCADRIQIKIGEFKATTFDELFDHIKNLEWEKYIGSNDRFPVQATSANSMLHSEPAIQSIVKKAVATRLLQKHQVKFLPENSEALFQIMVKANKDYFVVGIDSSGESLHKRGYRSQATSAPIKETLAAAIIKLSDWVPGRTLIDPFCGSGTFAIEAALMACNIAPGLNRKFAFQSWPTLLGHNIAELFSALLKEAHAATKPQPTLPFYSFDIDPIALKIANENAHHAGFTNLNFKRSDVRELNFSHFIDCTFIANPPYGERLEDVATVEQLYRDLGKKFAQSKNCSLFLLTSHQNFPQLFGRPDDKNRKLFNGKIRCYLFSFLATKK